MRELGASSHSRLAEDVRKVRLDRLWAQKKPRRDVPIRQAGRDEPRNLELLRRQLAAGRGITPTRALTGRPELGPRTLRPELGADGFEALQGCPEAFAGVSAALQSAQQLAVAELGSRALPAVPPAIVPLERFTEQGFVSVQDARAAEELGDRMWAAGPSGGVHSVRQQRLGLLSFAGARERLDERRQDRSWRDHLQGEAVATHSQRRAQRLDCGLGVAERELEQADAHASGLVVAEVTQDRVCFFDVRAALAFTAEHRLDPRKDAQSLGLLRPLTDGAHQPDALGGRSVRRLEIAGAGPRKRKQLEHDRQRAERSPLSGERLGTAQQS